MAASLKIGLYAVLIILTGVRLIPTIAKILSFFKRQSLARERNRKAILKRRSSVEVASLPPELLLEIFMHLDTHSLLNARLASKEWCRLISTDDSLWLFRLQKDFYISRSYIKFVKAKNREFKPTESASLYMTCYKMKYLTYGRSNLRRKNLQHSISEIIESEFLNSMICLPYVFELVIRLTLFAISYVAFRGLERLYLQRGSSRRSLLSADKLTLVIIDLLLVAQINCYNVYDLKRLVIPLINPKNFYNLVEHRRKSQLLFLLKLLFASSLAACDLFASTFAIVQRKTYGYFMPLQSLNTSTNLPMSTIFAVFFLFYQVVTASFPAIMFTIFPAISEALQIRLAVQLGWLIFVVPSIQEKVWHSDV